MTGSDRSSLLRNLAVIVGGVLVMNGLIFGLGWGQDQPGVSSSVLDPPGWLVGVVWTGLFTLLAIARWQLRGPLATVDRRWVTGLILFCWLYPVYAIAPNSMVGGFVGNLGTIALAGWIVWRVWPRSRAAAVCVAPIVPWVCFATLTMLVDWGWLRIGG